MSQKLTFAPVAIYHYLSVRSGGRQDILRTISARETLFLSPPLTPWTYSSPTSVLYVDSSPKVFASASVTFCRCSSRCLLLASEAGVFVFTANFSVWKTVRKGKWISAGTAGGQQRNIHSTRSKILVSLDGTGRLGTFDKEV